MIFTLLVLKGGYLGSSSKRPARHQLRACASIAYALQGVLLPPPPEIF